MVELELEQMGVWNDWGIVVVLVNKGGPEYVEKEIVH